MPEPRWGHALVTGASSGIGAAFARRLAPRCGALTLVARREARLRALAAELAGQCPVEVLTADLGLTEGVAAAVEHLRQRETVDLLVNNAGFSTFGPFAASDLDRELAMVRLHLDATLALTRAALPGMRANRRGAVINVASLAAFLPLPEVASYAATKAFLLSFSRSLQREVAAEGVRVQCLCPGYTRTEIHSRDSFAGFDTGRVPGHLWMDADAVVAESLAGLDSGRLLLVPGAENLALARAALAAQLDELGD